MIKPEDIPDELVGYQDGPDWISYGIDKEELASFINDAIKAGVVSPPCHVITNDHKFVRDPGYDRKIRVWPGKPPEDSPNAEHYRGQE